MSAASVTVGKSDSALPGHDRAAVEAKGQRIAAGLTAAALDAAIALPMVDRLALAVLALAVEAEIARRTGSDAPPVDQLPQLAAALARVERETAFLMPPAPAVGTSTRGHHHAPA